MPNYILISPTLFSRQFGTHQGNYYRFLPKEKFRIPPSPTPSPLGTMYVVEKSKFGL